MEQEFDLVWIVTDVASVPAVAGGRSGEDTGGSFGAPDDAQPNGGLRRRFAIKAADLKGQVASLIGVVGDAFSLSERGSGLLLDEVELSIEINSEGQVSILGSGGKLGGKGAIRMRFKRGAGGA